jgi:hypothetical protein
LIQQKIEDNIGLFADGKLYTEVLNTVMDAVGRLVGVSHAKVKRTPPVLPKHKEADEWAALTL